MDKHIDECAKVFLRDQKQLFDEPVAYDLEEAKEFLEDCMAVYCKDIKELREVTVSYTHLTLPTNSLV